MVDLGFYHVHCLGIREDIHSDRDLQSLTLREVASKLTVILLDDIGSVSAGDDRSVDLLSGLLPIDHTVMV
jgi:hypothetical protein